MRISFPVFPQLLPRRAPGQLRRGQTVAATKIRHHFRNSSRPINNIIPHKKALMIKVRGFPLLMRLKIMLAPFMKAAPKARSPLQFMSIPPSGRRWRQSVITENTQAFERQDRCPLHRHLPARHAFFAILHDTADSGTVSSASCSHGTRGRKENRRQACGVHGRGFASSSPHCAS